jgi:hypothetical protein
MDAREERGSTSEGRGYGGCGKKEDKEEEEEEEEEEIVCSFECSSFHFFRRCV